MPFFEFDQNNSRGIFKAPAQYLFIEALSAEDANEKAKKYGIYFDGVFEGYDCDCCGDRWGAVYGDGFSEKQLRNKIERVMQWACISDTEEAPLIRIIKADDSSQIIRLNREHQRELRKKHELLKEQAKDLAMVLSNTKLGEILSSKGPFKDSLECLEQAEELGFIEEREPHVSLSSLGCETHYILLTKKAQGL